MTDYENILVEQQDRVGIITLDRPTALNALDHRTMVEVVEAIRHFDAEEGIGAIVLTGSGKAFAAGADIREMSSKGYAQAILENWLSGWDSLTAVRTPLIAAVGGYALGGGCELAMMCDLIIASDTATFGQPEIRLGVIPGLGGSQRLTRAIGKAKAMDLILTGRSMGAEEAERAGLVSRVVPSAELQETAMAVAAEIAGYSLPVLYAAKEAVSRAFETSLSEGTRFERRAFHATFALDDQTEGMAAFLEKRPPVFRNR